MLPHKLFFVPSQGAALENRQGCVLHKEAFQDPSFRKTRVHIQLSNEGFLPILCLFRIFCSAGECKSGHLMSTASANGTIQSWCQAQPGCVAFRVCTLFLHVKMLCYFLKCHCIHFIKEEMRFGKTT